MARVPLIRTYLRGKLSSAPDGRQTTVTPTNRLGITIVAGRIGSDGSFVDDKKTIAAGGNAVFSATAGEAVLFFTKSTGAVIFVHVVRGDTYNNEYAINKALLLRPNDIGPPPEPAGATLVPPDSARVLVGHSANINGHVVTREQYWRRLPDSYSLAAGEDRTIFTSIETGTVDTSTEQQQVAKALGVSASGGFGPITASVSASLNETSASTHTVSLSEQRSIESTRFITNNTGRDVVIYHWQLMDEYHVVDVASQRSVATLIQANAPTLFVMKQI